jgi:hypothetical protein
VPTVIFKFFNRPNPNIVTVGIFLTGAALSEFGSKTGHTWDDVI